MIPKFLKTIVCVAAIAALAACGQTDTQSSANLGNSSTEAGEAEVKNTLDRIKETGTITVGLTADYPPFSFTEGEGDEIEYLGFEVDLANYLAAELIGEEATVQFIPLGLDERLETLDNGEVDLIIALTQTEERKQQVAFSEAYYSSGVGLIVPKSSDVQAWGDLRDQTVCTLRDSVFIEDLEALGMVVNEVEDFDDLGSALNAGDCEGGAIDDATIAGLLRDPAWWTEYKNSGLPSLFPTSWGMVARRGEENESFLEAVNLAILRMEAEGFIVQTEETWKIPPTDYVQERMELAKFAIAAQPQVEESAEDEESFLSGYLAIADGSSSILPVAQALSETFEEVHKGVRVGVGGTGISQGFEQLCNSEIDIVHAARPINEEEMQFCRKKRIRFVEMPFAFDGIAVVANPKNTWATCLTRSELKKIWEAEATGTVDNWGQVRDGFNDSPLFLSGPPLDSGTSEYFLEAIVGDETEGRADYDIQADETLIVQSVTAEEGGLGIVSISTYEANREVLKVLQVENEAGKCVAPSRQTIDNGTYSPLARPLFFYVSQKALEENPAVKELAKFFVDPENQAAIARFGYVPISGELLERVRTRLSNGVAGTLFAGGSAVGVNLSERLLGARTTEIPEGEQNEG
ncbi:MAG: phosphate ABC transporter substrate-binding protein PstS family protein [Cyanobacteria bacterium P01_E01_bin.42]